MEFIDEKLLSYCETHSEPESPLLRELNRETHVKAQSPRMLSGHLQGRFLAFLSKLIRPEKILEIGTYTGYSALCLAEGLTPAGELYTIDPNEETNLMARSFFERSPYAKKIRLIESDAHNALPELKFQWDLVFIDADKRSYSDYFDLVIDSVRPGGLVIADNVLWSGKVIGTDQDADTKAIRAFSQKVASDKRLEPLMLPVRDGLLLARKR